MMAMRFRSMGLVAAAAAAAITCYMVSLQVAAQRFALVSIEGKVISARQDIRRLQTEMGTRGRLVQLERWNSDVLALSAPKANQYLEGAFQLASYAKPAGELPPIVPVRAIAPPSPARVETVAYTLPAPQMAAPPMLRDATYVRPATAHAGAQKVALLDANLLGEIGKAAEAEAADRHARR